jgi:hypothetical protein
MNLFFHPPHGLSPSWHCGTPLDVTACPFQGFHCNPLWDLSIMTGEFKTTRRHQTLAHALARLVAGP